jgi:hypothetical protein
MLVDVPAEHRQDELLPKLLRVLLELCGLHVHLRTLVSCGVRLRHVFPGGNAPSRAEAPGARVAGAGRTTPADISAPPLSAAAGLRRSSAPATAVAAWSMPGSRRRQACRGKDTQRSGPGVVGVDARSSQELRARRGVESEVEDTS